MTIVDRVLTVLGRPVAALTTRSEWAPRVAVLGLLVLSVAPMLIVGATPEPSDISYEDLQAGQLPPMTTWLRLKGDLQVVPEDPSYTFTYPYTYTLRDTSGPGLAVTVVATAPLPTGRGEVTGRVSGALSVAGTFASIAADVPTKPGRQDPWLLFSLPAVVAIGTIVGIRAGYPVIRRERRPAARPVARPPGATIGAQLSGRIGTQEVPLDGMLSCTLAVAGDADTCDLIITDGGTTRTVTVRRGALNRRLRICRTGGCQPALEIHAPTADLMIAFANRVDRDRLAASLE
jgi:hypothetical protein